MPNLTLTDEPELLLATMTTVWLPALKLYCDVLFMDHAPVQTHLTPSVPPRSSVCNCVNTTPLCVHEFGRMVWSLTNRLGDDAPVTEFGIYLRVPLVMAWSAYQTASAPSGIGVDVAVLLDPLASIAAAYIAHCARLRFCAGVNAIICSGIRGDGCARVEINIIEPFRARHVGIARGTVLIGVG